MKQYPQYNDMMMLFTLYAFRRHGARNTITAKELYAVLSEELPCFHSFNAMYDTLLRLRQSGDIWIVMRRHSTTVELTHSGLLHASYIYTQRMAERP